MDYVRTARSKGLNNRAVIVGHALRNALIPIVTVLGMEFGSPHGRSVIVEKGVAGQASPPRRKRHHGPRLPGGSGSGHSGFSHIRAD